MLIKTFSDRQQELFEYFKQGKLQQFHRLLLQTEQDFPERMEKICLWRACAFSSQHEYDAAISVLQEALHTGIWWHPQMLKNDKDLLPLHGKKEFTEIIAQCSKLFEEHTQDAEAKLFVYGSQKADTSIFPLHWRGGNAEDFSSFWLDEKTETECVFGFPQSSQVFGLHAYSWDDKEKALREVTSLYEEFQGKFTAQNRIVAGASQGGSLALELCLKGRLADVDGFIAVIPVIRDEDLEHFMLPERQIQGLRGCLITGDQDPFLKQTVELQKTLEEQGIRCQLIIKKGMGHAVPEDFAKDAAKAVAYIKEV